MKLQLKKLLILIPLVFIGGLALAAYSFTAPASGPTSNNTDSPLDTSANDQIKDGGLSVNTFQSATGAYFAQQTSLKGMVRGGTPSDANSTISFGDSGHAVSVSNVGNTSIVGNFQSDSLKTGGGTKPLCADIHGTLYVCNTTPTTNTTPIYVEPSFQQINGSYYVYAWLSEATSSTVTVNFSASSVPTSAMRIKDMFTAEARLSGGCYYTATPTVIGSVTIYPDSTQSWNSVTLPAACDPSNTNVSISSYSPQTTAGGRPITAQ